MFKLSEYELAKKTYVNLAYSISVCMKNITEYLLAVDLDDIKIDSLPTNIQNSIKNISKQIKINIKNETSARLLKILGYKIDEIKKELEVMLSDKEYKKFIDESINSPLLEKGECQIL